MKYLKPYSLFEKLDKPFDEDALIPSNFDFASSEEELLDVIDTLQSEIFDEYNIHKFDKGKDVLHPDLMWFFYDWDQNNVGIAISDISEPGFNNILMDIKKLSPVVKSRTGCGIRIDSCLDDIIDGVKYYSIYINKIMSKNLNESIIINPSDNEMSGVSDTLQTEIFDEFNILYTPVGETPQSINWGYYIYGIEVEHVGIYIENIDSDLFRKIFRKLKSIKKSIEKRVGFDIYIESYEQKDADYSIEIIKF